MNTYTHTYRSLTTSENAHTLTRTHTHTPRSLTTPKNAHTLTHTNINTHAYAYTQVIDDPGGSKLLLVMEFVEGGPVLTRESLEKRDKLPEFLARQYFRDMVKVGCTKNYMLCWSMSPMELL